MKRSKNTQKKSVFNDSVVSFLVVLIGLALIGGLLTLIFAFVNGVFTIDHTPRTYEEFTVATAKSYLERATDVDKPQAWVDYIIALVDSGQMADAKTQLASLEASGLDMTRTQAILFAQAYILEAENRLDAAVELYRELAAKLMAAYDEEFARGGDKNWATGFGVPKNYYVAHLRMANIALRQEDWEAAVKAMDVYLEGNPQHAGMLIDRGNAKLALGDREGALKDFNAALRYLPNDPEALKGKEKAEE